MDKQEKLKYLQCEEIGIENMEYSKYYTIVDSVICKPDKEMPEYLVRAFYGNSVRKLSDDEIILKVEPKEECTPYGMSIVERVKYNRSLIDHLL